MAKNEAGLTMKQIEIIVSNKICYLVRKLYKNIYKDMCVLPLDLGVNFLTVLFYISLYI